MASLDIGSGPPPSGNGPRAEEAPRVNILPDPSRLATLGPADVALLGLPSDAGSSFLRGPALAPTRIREAFFSPSRNTCAESGRDLGAEPRWHDLGDLPLAEVDNEVEGEARRQRVTAAADTVLATGARLFSLGGDHSLTHPLLAAHARRFGALSVLQVDAHSDLYEILDGRRHSHASPFARALEEGSIARLVQVGVRTLNPHQQIQAERFGVEIITMADFHRGDRPSFEEPIYLSFDLDALDPAFAPGVSHHEPGGLSTRQALDLIQTLDLPLLGADLVELNPLRDPSGLSAFVAAKLMAEIADRLLVTPEVEGARGR